MDRELYAIAGITIMATTACIMGHDGYLITTAIAVVSAIGGYAYGSKKVIRKGKEFQAKEDFIEEEE